MALEWGMGSDASVGAAACRGARTWNERLVSLSTSMYRSIFFLVKAFWRICGAKGEGWLGDRARGENGSARHGQASEDQEQRARGAP